MSHYNVFNSEPTSEQSTDYTKHIAAIQSHCSNNHGAQQDEEGNDVFISCSCNSHMQKTTAWAKPFQRETDNKWVYPVCPESDAVYNTEEYDSSWVPQE